MDEDEMDVGASISLRSVSRHSRILDLDMNDMPLSDDQFSPNEQSTPKISTTPSTRSDNPAAVLRSLLSRLPAHPPTPKGRASPPFSDMESDGLRETDFSSQRESSNLGGVASFTDISEDDHSRSATPLGQQNGISSTPTQSKGSRRLKYGFKTPSPPIGLPDLPSPSSSDESENQSYRNIQSGSKWVATPKPPGGWLNTPKPSREVTGQGSPNDDATQRYSDTPTADDGLSYLKTPARAEVPHGFISSAKTPKPPGGWVSTPASAPIPAQSIPVDSPLDIPVRIQGLPTPVASFSKGSKLEPQTPAAPGAWFSTHAVKKSILKVRFEPEVYNSESSKLPDTSFDSSISGVNGLDKSDDSLQPTERLSSTPTPSRPSPRRQKSPKSLKIRVLDAFGREQDPDENHVEDAEASEAVATPSRSNVGRGELLSCIRNGLDDLVVGIDDMDKDGQPLSIDHDRVQELTSISSRARGLRERLISQVDTGRSSRAISTTKASWFPANPKFYIFLVILQLSLTWLVYRISIKRAQELWLNRYYDPFNPELHLYIFKSDPSMHVLGSEGSRTTAWPSLVRHIWDGWIYIIGNMQFRFWQASDKGPILRYSNAWTPT